MGDVSSNANADLQSDRVFSWPVKDAFRLLLSLAIAAAVFLATTVLQAPAAEYHSEIAVENFSDDVPGKMPCKEGFVCSAYILTNRNVAAHLTAEILILVISHNISFLHFKTPQVDPRPPRLAV